MTLEVRIPISPRPAWLNRARLIAQSIREFYPGAAVTVSIGDAQPYDFQAIIATLSEDDIGAHFVGQSEFLEWQGTECPYLATMMSRYLFSTTADHLLMLDADVLCTGRFDELFAADALSGVMAHVPPLSPNDWEHLFRGFGTPARMTEWHKHSGAGIMCEPNSWGPPGYFNSGMVFGPRALFERLAEPYFAAIAYLRRSMSNTYWFDQLGLALAIAKAQIPVNVLPLRWNFPNRPAFDAARPAELADVRFLHYLQTDIVDRDRDFATQEAMDALVARSDLTGSNERLRRHVADLIA